MVSSRKFVTIIICGLIWGSAYALPHTIGPEKFASLTDTAKETLASGALMAELIDRLESGTAPEVFATRPEAFVAPSYSYERSTHSINHDPAPESHNENLLLAGLGMLGFIAWRRLQS